VRVGRDWRSKASTKLTAWTLGAWGSCTWWDTENFKGHYTASRNEAAHSRNRCLEMPRGLPDRDAFGDLPNRGVVIA
jgi:hypothetical protein